MAHSTTFDVLNRTAILAALEAAHNFEFEALDLMGIDTATITQLQQLDLHSVVLSAKLPISVLEVRFNHNALNLMLQHGVKRSAWERLLNESIALGIRQPMLQQLCGMNRREFDQRRRSMGLPPPATGRISKLSEADEFAVVTCYHPLKNSPVDNPLTHLVNVSRETGISLDQVYTTLVNSNDIPG